MLLFNPIRPTVMLSLAKVPLDYTIIRMIVSGIRVLPHLHQVGFGFCPSAATPAVGEEFESRPYRTDPFMVLSVIFTTPTPPNEG